MKLKELLAEWLEQTELFEMAYSRQDAWRIVNGLSYPLAEHIVKILIMPNSEHIIHWKKEIVQWIGKMQDIILKPQNRRLKFEEYKQWLISQPEYQAKRIADRIKSQYKNEKITISPTLELDFQHIVLKIVYDLTNDIITDVDEIF
ncbi:MAG: hypothetical protein ACREAU_02970 [Nitrosopumilaceae archaeon]